VPVRDFLELFPEDGVAMSSRGLEMRVVNTVDRVESTVLVQWPGRRKGKGKLSPTGNHAMPCPKLLHRKVTCSTVQQKIQ
jgi:hypothetical protein